MLPNFLGGEAMNNVKLNTTYDFEFADGSKAELTLAFYKLYQLRSKNKTLYDRYNKIMSINSKGGVPDELETITVLYTAYVCANMDKGEIMDEETFLMLCGSDRKAVNDAVTYLLTAKKA